MLKNKGHIGRKYLQPRMTEQFRGKEIQMSKHPKYDEFLIPFIASFVIREKKLKQKCIV